MTYCSNCGIIIEDCKCPVCGWTNVLPQKLCAPTQANVSPSSQKTSENCASSIQEIPKCAPNPLPVRAPESIRPGQQGEAPCDAPRRSGLLVAGGVGAVLLSVSSLLLGLSPILNAMDSGDPLEFDSFFLYALLLFSNLMFLVGSLIMAAGFYGFFKYYGSISSIVAQVFVVIAPIVLLLFTLIALADSSGYSYYGYSEYSLSMAVWFGHILTGVMALFMGIALILVRRRTGAKEMSTAAGVLCIVSGSMLIGLMGIIGVGWIFFSVALLVCAVLFFLAHSPYQSSKAGTYRLQ